MTSSFGLFNLLPPALLLTALRLSLIHAANLSNCRGGCPLGELCIGNPFLQTVSDDECRFCAGGRDYWPCNFETACYCNSIEDDAPRVPPAPKTGYGENKGMDACRDILTEEIFNAIVQPKSEEGRALYTYAGLCDAITQYNTYHDEKFAGMGSDQQVRAELAAFLAHAAVDTNGFSVTREEMHCVDPITWSDGKVYCKPCKEEHYIAETKSCALSYFASEESYKSYCDSTRQPPEGCSCSVEGVKPVVIDGVSGYIPASSAYFTRGALEWNYDYYGASQAMTGYPNVLCDDPDLVATNPVHAWGSFLYKWMEKMKFGTEGSTAHRQVMKGNFGGTVEVLQGDLECPGSQNNNALHAEMVKDRVSQVCKSGAALGVYLEMDECDTPSDCRLCEGLREIFDSCQLDGSCPDCATWTQFLISAAPTVTPLRIESPSYEDWMNNYGQPRRSAAGVGASSWHAASLVFLISTGWLLVANQESFPVVW